jgi:hypothetical protein
MRMANLREWMKKFASVLYSFGVGNNMGTTAENTAMQEEDSARPAPLPNLMAQQLSGVYLGPL